MKSIIARAFLGACILTLPASLQARAEESVNTGGAPAVSLTDLGRMAEENIRKVESLIEERRKAERKAALDAEARRAFGRGVRLAESGDLDGSKKALKEALEITQSPEMRSYLEEQSRRRQEYSTAEGEALDKERRELAALQKERAAVLPAEGAKAEWLTDLSLSAATELKAAVQSRINLLNGEGETLFKADRLDESEAKFREVLKLDPSNLKAREYLGSLVPVRRAGLQRIALAEEKAGEAFERGNKLYRSGDLLGTRAAWVEAINTTEIPATKMGMAARISRLDTEIAVLYSKVDGLNSEGSALFDDNRLEDAEAKFREVLTLDPTNAKAMEYMDVMIPRRRDLVAARDAVEKKAEAVYLEANRLYAAGDAAGAGAAWQNAMALTQDVALKAKITAKVRIAEERKRQDAEAFQARIAGLYADGVALYDVGRLEDAGGKFREVIALDATHWGARQYLDHKIPGRKVEEVRKSQVEQAAKAAMEQGNKLYAAGDFEGAQAAWNKALEITRQQR
ncbi:MAG: hypothetical protein A3K90_02055 [Pelodictyon luteolum]|uniref:TPR repeat n=1 Tax=Pelodictyon luteolum TaxID=1100 RepID=A0A165KZV6_PELLU|nr:hypothetical protein [Pelodictyon luteolum]KZK73400.1 MAG: hypothetical protein A3K90_02055 [Pelodictyon luteolum]